MTGRASSRAIATLVMMLLSSGSASAGELFAYSPKLGLRLSNGIVQNAVAGGGAVFSLGGFDLLFSHFISPKFSLGLGYQTNFDFSVGTIPLNGFNFSGRYFFKGDGTRIKRETASVSSDTRDRLAMFAGLEAAQRNFFFALSNTTTTVSGTSLGLNGLVGADYALTKHFDLTAEASIGGATFASSDTRVKIKGYLFLFGFSYVW